MYGKGNFLKELQKQQPRAGAKGTIFSAPVASHAIIYVLHQQ